MLKIVMIGKMIESQEKTINRKEIKNMKEMIEEVQAEDKEIKDLKETEMNIKEETEIEIENTPEEISTETSLEGRDIKEMIDQKGRTGETEEIDTTDKTDTIDMIEKIGDTEIEKDKAQKEIEIDKALEKTEMKAVDTGKIIMNAAQMK
jgi:hypothetical protein